MPTALWLYANDDPIGSGELRRLGIPALAIDGDTWTCYFVHKRQAAQWPQPDVAVVPLDALDAVPLLGPGVRILIEVDWPSADSRPEAAAGLAALSNRISGVVARGARAASWAERATWGGPPVWLAPDLAARAVELETAAFELGLPPPDREPQAPVSGEVLWFCEPGDVVTGDEMEALKSAWGDAGAGRVVVAPPREIAWLKQLNLQAEFIAWSPRALQAAFDGVGRCIFPGPGGYSQARRKAVALRGGASAPAGAPPPSAFAPVEVANAWEGVLDALAQPVQDDGGSLQVLVFLDLVQDVDPILALLDGLLGREDVVVRIAVTDLLVGRSPRFAVEMDKRGLSYTAHDRSAVVDGAAPVLRDVDAVVMVAESSLRAHAPAYKLAQRAKSAAIPTFALQHGLENVGLHAIPGEDDAAVLSDHMFVWFPWEATPTDVSSALRPRLLHVGRQGPPPADVGEIRATLANFDSIVTVFENLHWIRYTDGWRVQFLTDCAAFAAAHPTVAVILKPHHAGIWAVKNRHLIPQWPSNLIVADPTDPFWEPHTAGSLVHVSDVVITTPSTVALDAAQAGKPVAICAYGLDLPTYAPLPMIQQTQDWSGFVAEAGRVEDARRRAAFLARQVVDDAPVEREVRHIVSAALEGRRRRAAQPVASRTGEVSR